jgi:hypothetical protein
MSNKKNVPSVLVSVAAAENRHYRRILEEQILSVLAARPQGLCEIVPRAGGAFPTELAIRLSHLIEKGYITRRGDRYSLAPKMIATYRRLPNSCDFLQSRPHSRPGRPYHSRKLSLPDPHPADYDWRFTGSALHALAQLLRPLKVRRSRVALLGAPSLFLRLADIGANVTLFDRNQSLIADLKKAGFRNSAIEQDMFSRLARNIGDFDVVVADPPWYLEFYEAFVARASQLLCDHGLFLLSMLPWLTRPSALHDRTEILRFANKAGFQLIQVLPEFLQYETPYFEKVALRHHGIACGPWRKADLFLFVKVQSVRISAWRIFKPDHEEWDDFRLGDRKIKLKRKKHNSSGPFSYRPVEDGSPVLRTVSRRWPHRPLIDVWTSDNEAYAVHGLGILRAALQLTQRAIGVHRAVSLVATRFSMRSKDSKNLSELLLKLIRPRISVQP